MAIRGSCLCGRVSFEVDRVIGPMEYCHCTRCRKVSGGAAFLTVVVRAADFRLLTGRELLQTYDAPILYSPPAYRVTFCRQCGSAVPEAEPSAATLEIPAGLFDDDVGIKPERHIFVDLKAPWDEIQEPLPQLNVRDVVKLRTGKELPADFKPKRHATHAAQER
jgi:hypothetical protein